MEHLQDFQLGHPREELPVEESTIVIVQEQRLQVDVVPEDVVRDTDVHVVLVEVPSKNEDTVGGEQLRLVADGRNMFAASRVFNGSYHYASA